MTSLADQRINESIKFAKTIFTRDELILLQDTLQSDVKFNILMHGLKTGYETVENVRKTILSKSSQNQPKSQNKPSKKVG